VEAIHFPLVDDVMLAAALRPSSEFAISGIYFRPTMHFPERWRGLKGRIRQTLKSVLVARFLARRDVACLMSFDPFFTDYAHGRYPGGAKVITLPEPVDLSLPDIPGSAERGERPVTFILFGGLQRRKGIIELLDALPQIDSRLRSSCAFVFCGEGELSGVIAERMPALRAQGIRIEFENRFLPEAELNRRLAESDVFLAPYQGHIGSSGVLYLAAAHKKPIITQNSDLIGMQVRHFRLGAAVDTADPRQIAAAIERLTDEISSGNIRLEADFDGLVRGHGREAFARTIVEHPGLTSN
jgi:glycosyltransferase involved in cell wall biosynthesis